jgi:N-acetylglucosaminyldiphosphoundecaprenol N-acetyl-beta-D-mannosaminyltransferase
MYRKVSLMGYDVFNDDLSSINIMNSNKKIINTINPHSYVVAKTDDVFKEALLASDTLIPDGSGIVIAAKQIYDIKINKIAGADLHLYLLSELDKYSGTVFYMGAASNTLVKIKERLAIDFPNVKVGTYSPPYKNNFSDGDNEVIIKQINSFSPDVLFIGMTAPKQEKWLYQHSEQLNFKISSSIGAVFDFYAGTIDRPSQFWINIHLEWLPRLLKEPKRLWRRNFVSTPLFLFDLIKEKIARKKTYK